MRANTEIVAEVFCRSLSRFSYKLLPSSNYKNLIQPIKSNYVTVKNISAYNCFAVKNPLWNREYFSFNKGTIIKAHFRKKGTPTTTSPSSLNVEGSVLIDIALILDTSDIDTTVTSDRYLIFHIY